jgi:quercetin dioxygenase-like cupin family protein
MEGLSLESLIDDQLAVARSASAGRSARTVHGGREHALRQTVIALAAGRSLGEHESPGEATLQVLRGSVRLHADGQTWSGARGGFLRIPETRHDLEAVEDSAVLLTVALERAQD